MPPHFVNIVNFSVVVLGIVVVLVVVVFNIVVVLGVVFVVVVVILIVVVVVVVVPFIFVVIVFVVVGIVVVVFIVIVIGVVINIVVVIVIVFIVVIYLRSYLLCYAPASRCFALVSPCCLLRRGLADAPRTVFLLDIFRCVSGSRLKFGSTSVQCWVGWTRFGCRLHFRCDLGTT
jgi:hypothetical protein